MNKYIPSKNEAHLYCIELILRHPWTFYFWCSLHVCVLFTSFYRPSVEIPMALKLFTFKFNMIYHNLIPLKLWEHPGKYEFWVWQIIIRKIKFCWGMKTSNCFILLYLDVWIYFYMSKTEEFRQKNEFTKISNLNETHYNKRSHKLRNSDKRMNSQKSVILMRHSTIKKTPITFVICNITTWNFQSFLNVEIIVSRN